MGIDRRSRRQDFERRSCRPGPGRRGRGMQLWAMALCLVSLVALLYGGMLLYERLRPQSRQTMQGTVNSLTLDEDGNVTQTGGPGSEGQEDGEAQQALSDAIVYSQEELDAQVEKAASQARAEAAAPVLDAIRTSLTEGDTVLETLRPLYPDHIIVASGGQYHFVPVNRSLAQSQLLTENLNFLDSGEIQYLTDGQVTSHKGVDVSKFQGDIDWTLVAQDGVEFAFIRVGNRGYGQEGRLVEDEKFTANIEGAIGAGIKVGVYFYTQAVNEQEMLEEANLVLSKIAPYQIECPVVLDVEKVSNANGRMNSLTVEERTALARLFCQTIAQAGYRPMIYHNTEMGALMLDLTQLEEYDKWLAAYSDTLYYPYAYQIWQYSDRGHVQGIAGEVDMNISFGPLWESPQ